MKILHHWFYITLLSVFLCSAALPEGAKLESADEEEEQVAKALLRPRNLYDRRPGSTGGSSAGTWNYSRPSDTDFSVGFFITEDLNIKPAASEESSALTSDTESSQTPLPVLSVRLGYKVSASISLIAAGGVDFSSGIRDPLAGASMQVPIAKNFASLASLTISVPVSTASQSASRLTAITASVSPLYHRASWFVGADAFFSYFLYKGQSSDSDAGNSTNARSAQSDFSNLSGLASGVTASENTRTGGNLYGGHEFTEYFSANLGLAVTNTYLQNGNFAWHTEATLTRLTVNHAGFAASAAFSFLSAKEDVDQMSLPTQPYVGFRLQYVFGDQPTLGLNRTESVPNFR